MIKQIYDEQALPMGELQTLGLAENGRLNINENDLKALLSGRRTGMLTLENLTADGIHIPALDAKLSVNPNANGSLGLLVHPIYRQAEYPMYLTDTEAEMLEKGDTVNIQKQVIDQQGRKREILVEFDKDTKEFIIIDSERILAPDMVNGQYLSLEQKERYKKGKEVEMPDGTTLQYSATDLNGMRSNKRALIVSLLLDGGLTYMVLKGLDAVFNKPQDKENADVYSREYYETLEKMQEKERGKGFNYNNHFDNQHSRGYSQGASR